MRSSSKPFLLASALLLFPLAALGSAQIDETRELSITNLGVVEDSVRTVAGGAWHFGTMMTNIAGDVPPARFVEDWLQTITEPQTVNGVTVFNQTKANAMEDFLELWPKNPVTGRIKLASSPFRLLAIVNRPDLVQVGPQGPTSYGECRFVYGSFNPANPSGLTKFFVIFEFDVPADTCAEVVGWASAWHGLANHAAGSPAYRAALQAITDAIVLPVPGSSRPNRSNLKQLRNNDFFVLGAGNEWSLREWNLVSPDDPDLATLTTVTTKQTPHFSFLTSGSGLETLATYLLQNQAAIKAGTHVVPDFFAGLSFQSGNARNFCGHLVPAANCGLGNSNCSTQGTKWWAPGFVPLCNGTESEAEIRHKFALQTCSGCHHQETGVEFTHVSHRLPGAESQLSTFLTGGPPVADPFLAGTFHSFNDLQHRKEVLLDLLDLDCNGTPSPNEKLAAIQAEIGTRVH